ncbi:MAG: ABC transporter ATP-binding protein [Clostridia bacterium]|nr:ABC transporter ATP-binding protein [Clostridia bacterium]
MITIKDLSKSYDGQKMAVDHINLDIRDGDIFGFVGLNGAGKSTTIKCLVGILEFNEGEILINGRSIKASPMECKKDLAYISDNPEIYAYMRGIDYVKFILSVYNRPYDNDRVVALAREFEIDDVLGNLVSSYSHGMKQKLVLMAAFLHEPKLLVLDEPFVGLDPKATHMLKTMMKDYAAKGNTIFFSTHVLEVAEKLCNKVAIIKNGRIVVSGTMEEITQSSSLEEFFLEVNNE